MVQSQETPDEADGESITTKRNTEYVAKSSNRTTILRRLVDGPAAASEVAEKQSIPLADTRKRAGSLSVSKAETGVEQLRDRGLVELLATDETRAYGLTAMGEQVVFSLDAKREDAQNR